MNFLTQSQEVIENEFVIVDLKNESITWKSGMFNPKMQNNILYWFAERRKLGLTK